MHKAEPYATLKIDVIFRAWLQRTIPGAGGRHLSGISGDRDGAAVVGAAHSLRPWRAGEHSERLLRSVRGGEQLRGGMGGAPVGLRRRVRHGGGGAGGGGDCRQERVLRNPGTDPTFPGFRRLTYAVTASFRYRAAIVSIGIGV